MQYSALTLQCHQHTDYNLYNIWEKLRFCNLVQCKSFNLFLYVLFPGHKLQSAATTGAELPDDNSRRQSLEIAPSARCCKPPPDSAHAHREHRQGLSVQVRPSLAKLYLKTLREERVQSLLAAVRSCPPIFTKECLDPSLATHHGSRKKRYLCSMHSITLKQCHC